MRSDEKLKVRRLDQAQFAYWDAFVQSCDEATFFHRAGWKTVIERAFGHPTHYLYVEGRNGIEGVLPMAELKSLLFGHSLISLPFCVYGGVAATTEQARMALDDAACALAQRLRVDHMEYRSIQARHPEWHHKDVHVTFRKLLDPDPERNLAAIPRKQRAMVRKGIKAGLESSIDDGMERIYAAYSTSVHRLGTPMFPKSYFPLLREVFGVDCDVLTVTLRGQLVSSVLSFYFRDEVLPYYGGGTDVARDLAGNDYMYWELMRRSCEKGLKAFDFGRSKRGTGSYEFKRNWGFEPQPLGYEYLPVRGEFREDDPRNLKYRLLIGGWQRLPLGVANFLGPYLTKNLPW